MKKPAGGAKRGKESKQREARKTGSRLLERTPRFTSAKKLLTETIQTKWNVRGLLPANALVACVGTTEAFKTAVVVDVLSAVANGYDWHGRKVKKGPVFLVAGEGRPGIARRLKAIEIDRGIKISRHFYVSDGGTSLVSRKATSRLIARIRSHTPDGRNPAIVVFDTVARNFAPGDENSAADMGAFVDNADRIRRKLGCTVILVHHTGHANTSRARGSSAFKAAIDAEILFERRGDQVTMKCTKSKEAKPFDDICLDVHEVRLPDKAEDGSHETSIVLKPADLVTKRGAVPYKQLAAFRVLKKLLAAESDDNVANDDRRAMPVRVWCKATIKAGIVSNEDAFDKLKGKLKKREAIVVVRGLVSLK